MTAQRTPLQINEAHAIEPNSALICTGALWDTVGKLEFPGVTLLMAGSRCKKVKSENSNKVLK